MNLNRLYFRLSFKGVAELYSNLQTCGRILKITKVWLEFASPFKILASDLTSNTANIVDGIFGHFKNSSPLSLFFSLFTPHSLLPHHPFKYLTRILLVLETRVPMMGTPFMRWFYDRPHRVHTSF